MNYDRFLSCLICCYCNDQYAVSVYVCVANQFQFHYATHWHIIKYYAIFFINTNIYKYIFLRFPHSLLYLFFLSIHLFMSGHRGCTHLDCLYGNLRNLLLYENTHKYAQTQYKRTGWLNRIWGIHTRPICDIEGELGWKITM